MLGDPQIRPFAWIYGNAGAPIPGPLVISPTGAGVDPASSFGINLNTATPPLTGEQPAISYVGATGSIFRVVFDSINQQSAVIMRRANGTIALPLPLNAFDVIHNWTARGYRGDRYTSGAEGSVVLEARAAENWSPTAVGGIMLARTMTVGFSDTAHSLYRWGLMQGLQVSTQASGTSYIDPGPGAISADNFVLVGSPIPITTTQNAALQVHGTTAGSAATTNTRWSADTLAPQTILSKSRGATVGTHGLVLAGDVVGNIIYSADDGTTFQRVGQIQCVVDGTASAGIVPGRLVFLTANSAGVSAEAMRLDSTQTMQLVNFLRINQNPTANTSASTTITSGADSSTNLGHRIQFNLNGTTYWFPCGSVAF